MINQLKIGMVTAYPPSKTTLNEYGFHLTRHFQDKGEVEELQLYVEHLPDNQKYESDSDKLKFIPCWSFNAMGNAFSILKQIRKHKPDVVIINLQFLLFGDKKVAAALGLMLPGLLRLFEYKNIVLLHNIMEEVDLTKAGLTSNPVLKWAYGIIGNILTRFILTANLVGVTIEKYVDVLKAKYKKKNIVLLPHGSFEVPPTPDYSIPEGPRQVMTFGKFGTYKKVEVLIEAIIEVRKRVSFPIELVVAGTDNPNVAGYLDGVQEKYKAVPDMVFTGYVEEEDVPRIFKPSTAVVFPYTSTTGSSGVLHQAGSYGKAAILPNLGDLALLVEEEGYRGEFFEPENVESLAKAIELLLTDDAYRNQLERANFRAAASLSMADIADWYLIHIDKLLDKH
ncbi:glycosyltransferase [Reichenbachiella agarivorans]|uniref:Glycosyltransferase n=1 Tax=Reichenbachiella agarivorans TaxID=2979464 RepID=A0ABY6CV36_9BACT|nr:glycosyltransferase [Reichenbachiella agarivorans]UXP32100.1 glycosyltransferase [Reichenbachiella agarivorans]